MNQDQNLSLELSNSDSENTPPYITEKAQNATENLLPEVSKEKYQKQYNKFMNWREMNNIKSFSENVLLAYFQEISQNFKPSTLWSIYSMIRSLISIKNNIDISKYTKLRAYLKKQNEKSSNRKKSLTLTTAEIQKFLKEAPDDIYLLVKVAMVFGLSGACRREELWKLTIDNVKDLQEALLVTLPTTKTKISRTFTVVGKFYDLYKKYAFLRPQNTNEKRLFLNYQHGKCTRQVVGINKFGNMPKQIAEYLKLPNSKLYTGHCFRRSSATILANSGGDLLTLKRHGGWRSNTVAEGYIDDSISNKIDIANKIEKSIIPGASTSYNNIPNEKQGSSSSLTNTNITINENLLSKKDTPSITIQNCSNFTINYKFN